MVQFLARRRLVTGPGQRDGQVIADGGIVGCLAGCLPQQVESPRGVAILRQDPSQGVLHIGRLRGEFVGLFGCGLGLRILLLEIESGQVVEEHRILAFAQEELVLLDGLPVPSGLGVVPGKIDASGEVVRVLLQPRCELDIRLGALARPHKGSM